MSRSGELGADMRRREFITVTCGVVVWPLTATGQQQLPVIGFLHVAAAGPLVGLVDAFRRGLEETGYTERQNVAIEFRWADGDYGRIPALVAELVGLRVAVLVTGGGEGTAFAAKAATTTIPIVCNVGTDPVKTGLVASLSRPGGNITGINILTSELATKRVGLLHDLVPTGSVFAHLVNPNFPSTESIIEQADRAAQLLGLKTVVLKATSKTEIETAFASIREKRTVRSRVTSPTSQKTLFCSNVIEINSFRSASPFVRGRWARGEDNVADGTLPNYLGMNLCSY